MEYNGISSEALFLLADNRFRNSRDYYEEHKEEIKEKIIIPLRQLAGIIGEELISIDPLMNTIPTKMVSRVRRDTRYTKDKSLYRDNMWIMFMRPKKEWHCYPCMWFEVTQCVYTVGVGFFGCDPGLMQTYRKALRERGSEFLKAVSSCLSADAAIAGEKYKRMPEGCPDGFGDFYARKDIGFIRASANLDELSDERIVDAVRDTVKAYSPMYKFLLGISDEYFEKG